MLNSMKHQYRPLPVSVHSVLALVLLAINGLACAAAGSNAQQPTELAQGLITNGFPDPSRLPFDASGSTTAIDPAGPVMVGETTLVSGGFTPGNPAQADPLDTAVEWGVYPLGGFDEGMPLYLELDLTGSTGEVWLGLSDYAQDTWGWRTLAPAEAGTVDIELPQQVQYTRADDGAAFMLLVVPRDCSLRFHGGTVTGSGSLVDGLYVNHRSGQSFITWPEDAASNGETYRVYRHSEAVTAANLAAAELLYEVPEGSGTFYADRFRVDEESEWEARFLERYIISDLGNELPEETGLLVWTTQPGQAGEAYYGVTLVDSEGVEDASGLAVNMAFGPVTETEADPRPVEAIVADNGRAHLFIQYMDLADWNPTFDAPNPLNEYYGLDPADPRVSGAVQYAYLYIVAEPDPANLVGLSSVQSAVMYLHGMGGTRFNPPLTATSWFTPLMILPIDVNNTWYFGFARDHDYRTGTDLPADDTIVNYTEQRLLRMFYDTMRHPDLGPRVDPQRLYVYGGSMGGSGTLALAQRYPNVLACAYASLPMTNYQDSELWLAQASSIWGTPEQALPVEIAGPNGWTDHLAEYNGTSVWTWQNHQKQLAERRGSDMVPIGIKHGRQDDVIDWPTQGKPVYSVMNGSGQCWGGAALDTGHEGEGWDGLPAGLLNRYSGDAFGGLLVVRDESVPGLSNATGDADLPPDDGPGEPAYWNRQIEWSSSWDDWAGAPLEDTGYWEIAMRTRDGSTQQVDITPRRLQSFAIDPAYTYAWSNLDIASDTLIQTGQAAPDADGVLTVHAFNVSGTGNRLMLIRID